MNRIGRIYTRIIIAFLIIAVLFCIFKECIPSAKAEEITLTATCQYMQSDARSLLTLINEFRQSEDAWYWDFDDVTKIYLNNLPDITWDYNLEQIAMQRALETAIRFGHTRIDGTSWSSVTCNGTSSCAENLAGGHRSVGEVYFAWREDNQKSGGQIHRRIMLGEGYTAIGAAHVVYEGEHFWALEFGRVNSGASDPGAVEGNVSKSFSIDFSKLKPILKATFDESPGDLQYGLEQNLPKISIRLYSADDEYAGTWSKGFWVNPSDYTITWEVEEPERIALLGSKYRGIGLGDAHLVAKAEYHGMSLEYRMKETVVTRRVWNYSIDPIPLQYYTGKEVYPHTDVKVDGEILTEGKDYSVAYQDNIGPGYALMIITFSENYSFSWRDWNNVFYIQFEIGKIVTNTPSPTEKPIVSPTEELPSVTPTLTEKPTEMITPSPLPTDSIDNTPTPTISPTKAPTRTVTPNPVLSPTPTLKPTPIGAQTPIPSPSPAITENVTVTPSEEASITPTDEPDISDMPTVSVEPTPTATLQLSPTPTLKPTEGMAFSATPSPEPTSSLNELQNAENNTEANGKKPSRLPWWTYLVILLALIVVIVILTMI
ncbi:MAG: hypothetical protein J6S79_01735 [Lachnospiraceae bacterium]|nr:hypothetical protein [Lachnospiraceae bacterium]